MNQSIDKPTETTYFLSDLIGTKVIVQGKRVGKLDDLSLIHISEPTRPY